MIPRPKREKMKELKFSQEDEALKRDIQRRQERLKKSLAALEAEVNIVGRPQ